MLRIGTVIKIEKGKTYLFTDDLTVTAIKSEPEHTIGRQISFMEELSDKPKAVRAVGSERVGSKVSAKKIVSIIAVIVLLCAAAFVGKMALDSGNNDSAADSSVTDTTTISETTVSDTVETTVAETEPPVSETLPAETSDVIVTTVVSENEVTTVTPRTSPNTTTPQQQAVEQQISFSASVSGNNLNFSWTKLPEKGRCLYKGKEYTNFLYYKVVASATNMNPVFPADGWLYQSYLLQTGSWKVNPFVDKYNESPKLEAGKSYYFSVTYVFRSGSFSAAPVSLTMPSDTQTQITTTLTEKHYVDFNPVLSVSISDKKLIFNWSVPQSPDVMYYGNKFDGLKSCRVVASATNSGPIFPDDGWIFGTSDLSQGTWTADIEAGNYNAQPTLVSGQQYYFSVTYYFDDAHRIFTNTVPVIIP